MAGKEWEVSWQHCLFLLQSPTLALQCIGASLSPPGSGSPFGNEEQKATIQYGARDITHSVHVREEVAALHFPQNPIRGARKHSAGKN